MTAHRLTARFIVAYFMKNNFVTELWEVVNIIPVFGDWDKWQAVVNTVMNTGFNSILGNVSASLGPVIFSRRTLFCEVSVWREVSSDLLVMIYVLIINRFTKTIPVAIYLGLMDPVWQVESKTQQEYLHVSFIYRTCTGQLYNKGIMVLLNNSEAETNRMFNSWTKNSKWQT